MRIPPKASISSAPARQAVGLVIVSDPQDNNVPQKAVRGDVIRVQLLAREGQGLWQVISTNGPTGKFTNVGLVGEFQVFEWDTKGVKAGRFTAVMQRPAFPRQPPRVFNAIIDIA